MNEANIILNAAKVVFGFLLSIVRDNDKKRLIRKQEISKYFSELAETIENVAAALREGKYPHGSCEKLLSYSTLTVGTTKDFLGEEQAQYFATQLRKAYTIENLSNDVIGKPEEQQEQNLRLLDEAAGRFRAAAALCRVSP